MPRTNELLTKDFITGVVDSFITESQRRAQQYKMQTWFPPVKSSPKHFREKFVFKADNAPLPPEEPLKPLEWFDMEIE